MMSSATMARNLRTLLARASATDIAQGKTWYPRARAIVHIYAERFAISPETVACVIAATSPQCEWKRNLQITYDVLAMRPLRKGFAMHGFVSRARRIREEQSTDVLATMRRYYPTGYKVQAFAQNLIGCDTAVTVDSHAAQAAVNDITRVRTDNPRIYNAIASAYVDVAGETTYAPAELQAILWHTWKALYPATVKRHILRTS